MQMLTKRTACSGHPPPFFDAYIDGFDAEYNQYFAGLYSLSHHDFAGDCQTYPLGFDNAHPDGCNCPFHDNHEHKHVDDDGDAAGHDADIDDIEFGILRRVVRKRAAH